MKICFHNLRDIKIRLHDVRDIFNKLDPRISPRKISVNFFCLHQTTSTRSWKCWFFSNKFNLFLKYKFSKINSYFVAWDLMNVASYIPAKEPSCLLYKKERPAEEIWIYIGSTIASSTRKSSKPTLLPSTQKFLYFWSYL